MTRLLVPKEIAEPKLLQLRVEGADLADDAELVPEARSKRNFHQLTGEAESWSLHIQRLLRNWFSDQEIALEFASPRGSKLPSYTSETRRGAWEVRNDLQGQLMVLDSLLARLDDYAIPVAGSNTSPSKGSERLDPSVPSYVTYNIRGSVGQLIAGEGQRVSNINSHIAAVMGQGETQVAAALQRLAEVTLSDPDLDQPTRAEVLETIEDLGEAAEAQPEQRKAGRIKGAIAVIGEAAGAAGKLGEAWHQWGPVITEHLRLPSG